MSATAPTYRRKTVRTDNGFVPALLREHRVDEGWTQEHLADLAGIARPLVSEYERGVKTPTRKTLQALADALDISPAALCED